MRRSIDEIAYYGAELESMLDVAGAAKSLASARELKAKIDEMTDAFTNTIAQFLNEFVYPEKEDKAE